MELCILSQVWTSTSDLPTLKIYVQIFFGSKISYLPLPTVWRGRNLGEGQFYLWTCLKVIFGEDYLDYQTALEIYSLETLETRRKKRCIKHPRNRRLFPENSNLNSHDFRIQEPFTVNFARTSSYKNSSIPYCQRLLNEHFMKKF